MKCLDLSTGWDTGHVAYTNPDWVWSTALDCHWCTRVAGDLTRLRGRPACNNLVNWIDRMTRGQRSDKHKSKPLGWHVVFMTSFTNETLDILSHAMFSSQVQILEIYILHFKIFSFESMWHLISRFFSEAGKGQIQQPATKWPKSRGLTLRMHPKLCLLNWTYGTLLEMTPLTHISEHCFLEFLTLQVQPFYIHWPVFPLMLLLMLPLSLEADLPLSTLKFALAAFLSSQWPSHPILLSTSAISFLPLVLSAFTSTLAV